LAAARLLCGGLLGQPAFGWGLIEHLPGAGCFEGVFLGDLCQITQGHTAFDLVVESHG